MPNLIVVVAPKDFRDEEYLEPRRIFDQAGIGVKVVSSQKGEIIGVGGARVNAEMTLDEVKSEDFDGIVFIGGPGTRQYFRNSQAQNLARAFFEQGKLVAAICIAPVILANAGILEAKRVTVFQSETGAIQEKGAHYTASSVEVDGNIITGSGPQAAQKFGQEIVSYLKRM